MEMKCFVRDYSCLYFGGSDEKLFVNSYLSYIITYEYVRDVLIGEQCAVLFC